MATYRGIEGACQAVVELLRDNYDPADFPLHDLEFRVMPAPAFEQGLTAGVSVFLYRVIINAADRTPPGRRTDSGGRFRNQLPVDLNLMLTAWGSDPSLQQSVAGWMMRTLEDFPILPAGLLNRRTPDVFRPDETVELTVGEIPTEDLLHLWELFGNASYQLSVPYVARNVRIESARELVAGGPVQDRVQEYAVLGGSGA